MSFFFGRLLALQDLASIYFGFCSQFKLHCPTSILEIRAKYDRISLAHPLASQQIMYIEQRTEDHCTFCLRCVSHPSQVVWTSKPLPDHHWKTSCCSFSFLFFVSLTWWGYAEPLSVSICLVTRDSKPAQKLWAMDSLLSELQWPKASVPAVLLFKANSTSALDWISCRVCMVDAASSKKIPPLFNASYPDSPTSKFIQMYFTQTSKNQSHHHVHRNHCKCLSPHRPLLTLIEFRAETLPTSREAFMAVRFRSLMLPTFHSNRARAANKTWKRRWSCKNQDGSPWFLHSHFILISLFSLLSRTHHFGATTVKVWARGRHTGNFQGFTPSARLEHWWPVVGTASPWMWWMWYGYRMRIYKKDIW